MSEDPHALKLYIDGNAYDNPGGSGGYACFAKFPESWNRPDEQVFSEGFHETTNNRMELCACIRALEYVVDKGRALGVDRVQIFTDSMYVYDHQRRPSVWRRDGWKARSGKPIENPDLWKRYLSVRAQCKVRTDILWTPGKKRPILKSVDRAAKAAGKAPSKSDRGFRMGKIGKSKVQGGSSSPFPAKGQEQVIRIYRSALIGKAGHKIHFNIFDVQTGQFHEKHTAYASDVLINELHRGNTYRVQFNSDMHNPQVVTILERLEVTPDSK